MTYYAKGAEIWLRNADVGKDELFLTVHQTTCPMTAEAQAEVLVTILNDL